MSKTKIAMEIEILHALAKVGINHLMEDHDFTKEDLAEELEVVARLEAMLPAFKH